MWYLDEINTVRSEDSKKAVKKYEEYFSVMALNPEQIRKRILFARELEDALFMLFLAWLYGADEQAAQDEFVERYLYTVEQFDDVGLEFDFVEYIVLLAASLYESTMRNIDDPYYTSFDRATYVAANEANTALNKIEYTQAVKGGMTKKTWHTEQDLRVRHTHVPMDGKTIPIDGVFDVGGVKMKYPKDVDTDGMNPSLLREITNCRCAVSYE